MKRLCKTGSEPIVSARFNVDQWAAYGFNSEEPNNSIVSTRHSAVPVEAGSSSKTLPTTLRRRTTPIGRLALSSAHHLDVPDGVRFIFCSRNGEFERTLRILTALAADEPVSPAEFSLSVHNALAGLLSIAWRNTAGHTTIAAGADTFGSALVEAAACLIERPEKPVLLLYYDDSLPEPYDEIDDGKEACVVLAMLLTSPRQDGSDVILERQQGQALPAARSSTDEARAFFRLLANEVEGRPGDGEFSQWLWRRV